MISPGDHQIKLRMDLNELCKSASDNLSRPEILANVALFLGYMAEGFGYPRKEVLKIIMDTIKDGMNELREHVISQDQQEKDAT